MRTLDEQSTERDSVVRRLQRDLKLLWRIQGMLLHYFTTGARTRRAYRAKEAAGEVFWVDE